MAWQDEVTRLARERGPALVGYAYLLTRDLGAAEDLVQEALARAWARPRSLTDVHVAEAYVRRMVVNAFLDERRRGAVWNRRRHLVVAPDVQSDGADRSPERIDVQDALAALPPRERACVVLRFYDDLTVPALAEHLGISPGTAKRYLSDGLHRLEQTLGPIDLHAQDSAPVVPYERTPR
jgi:RNA polymerase sigma-70 factor (sigma-E family)